MTKIESALKTLEGRYGKGVVIKMGEKPSNAIDAISTRCASLDNALGIGGLPKGRITEIFGPESSGKSTIALQVVAEAQKQGGACVYIDTEFALDVDYAKALGVDIDELFLSQPDSAEQGFEVAEAFIRSGEVALIVIDSIAAMSTESELAGEMGDAQMGGMARLMSQALRKLKGTIANTNTCVLLINQIRQKIGVVYGNPETTPGGSAIKFYSSVRMRISRTGDVKQGEEVIGNRTKVKVVKNKLAPPFKTCEFDILFGQGVSEEGDVLDLAVASGVIEKSGAWFKYEENRWQGKENARKFLKENKDIYEEIKAKL